MKKYVKLLIIIIITLGSLAASMTIFLTPPVKGDKAPEDEFSSARAMEYVRSIARVPHVTGSPQNVVAEDYIVNKLKELGLDPEVQKTHVKYRIEKFNAYSESDVENIIATIKGTGGGGKAILLTAHYDSTPGGPGAADDASGVAAILETARAIKADKPMKNDVIILISDGEELMCLGAAGFANEHPLMKEVGLVMNLEARGNSGPSLMFETGDGNEPYMRDFKKVVDYPVAFSFLYDMYRMMPNGTDFTVYKDAGLNGFNFAYIGNPENYHADTDTPDNLDMGSLQHHGDYILSLARYYGNIDLGRLGGKNTNSVYFTIFRGLMVEYSYKWIIFWTALALILFTGALIAALKKNKISLKGFGKGILLTLISMIAAVLTVFVLWGLFKNLVLHTGNMSMYQRYDIMRKPLLNSLGFGIFTAAAAVMLWMSSRICRRWANGLESVFSGMFIWALLMILSSFVMQGFSYIFTWPLIFASAAVLLILLVEKDRYREVKYIAGFLLTCLPAFIIFVPIVYLVLLGLMIDAAAIIILIFTIPAVVVIPFAHMYLNLEHTAEMDKPTEITSE